MDPNTALREIRELADNILNGRQVGDARDLAEKIMALDAWLSRGGFPPEEWREGPDAQHEHVVNSAGECVNCREQIYPDLSDDDNYTGPTFRETED
jgi:hypothetical protein